MRCMKCKATKEVQDARTEKTKNGRTLLKCTCPTCGKTMCRFAAGEKKASDAQPSEEKKADSTPKPVKAKRKYTRKPKPATSATDVKAEPAAEKPAEQQLAA